jgi:hypothetical protein
MNGNTPKQRAKTLKTHLAAIYDDGRGATKANVTDILTDLRHLCDAEGIDFADCDRNARDHYLPEIRWKSIATA